MFSPFPCTHGLCSRTKTEKPSSRAFGWMTSMSADDQNLSNFSADSLGDGFDGGKNDFWSPNPMERIRTLPACCSLAPTRLFLPAWELPSSVRFHFVSIFEYINRKWIDNRFRYIRDDFRSLVSNCFLSPILEDFLFRTNCPCDSHSFLLFFV